ncbi:hypothetical protein GPECTOR_15g431 [Gonium pectorale]|uniref:Ferric oxidoreductase domain-containing protein n=1 Tax=Gonium pectorale TaxID=33097 RepID=A0A150GLK8_GONPE|nr:hypothetical protein GPECTOR_15g431 [Gonium pectorale]|eukprot:KXZ50746.1 hypothetical protein GPECTOR_15g431 [Gonium pectorale]
MPSRAKALLFYFWIALNVVWFIQGIRYRDFTRKPKWLRHPSAVAHGEAAQRWLRLSYGLGMAACWPLLANTALLLAPVERGLLLLGGLMGAGHEEGVLAHALCGTAVWVWASVHAVLTQAPMLAAGLWRVIVLPAGDGSDTKGTSNFMGLLAWLLLCALGLTSLAPVRRAAFNAFQLVHIVLAPLLLLLACMHDSKVFWYGMLGAVLYGADLVQRRALRRRAVLATATVPEVSGWEAHPYSVAACDDSSFALVIKAGGNWERRLCALVERRAAAAVTAAPGPAATCQLEVLYEGLYGTPDLQAAAAGTDRLLLFAGGAGVTPLASLMQAVLRESADAQPLLPLLRAAAARGWRVDLHCTRAPALAAVVEDTAMRAPAAQGAADCAKHRDPAQRTPPPQPHLALACREEQPLSLRGQGSGRGQGAAAGKGLQRLGEGSGPPPAAPWQLHGPACWAVAAAGAAAAALCGNLFGATVGVMQCKVLADAATVAAAAAASMAAGAVEDGSGGGGAEAAQTLANWVASVRSAFASAAAGLSALPSDAAVSESPASPLRRILRALWLGAGAASCPTSLTHHTGGGGGDGDGGGSVSLTACRASLPLATHGSASTPELCVKCDPFKPRSPLEQAWPCCSTPVCFYGARVAPLLGWAAGLALGAALACLVWRRVAFRRWQQQRRRGAVAGGSWPRGLPGPPSAGKEQRGVAVSVAAGPDEWSEPLLPRPAVSGADGLEGALLAAAEEGSVPGRGGSGREAVAEGLGLEAMLAGLLGPLGGAGGAELDGGCSGACMKLNGGDASGGCGGFGNSLRVHVGRPDVDAYVRAAVSTTGGDGGTGSGRVGGGGLTFGVVTCGPESLQAAAQAAYDQHLGPVFPGSWFRSFSFTT